MYYRRAKQPGGTYFFTIVTYNREEIFRYPDNISILKSAFLYAMENHPFDIDAIVIIPDHIHCILTLPKNDIDYPTRIRLFKTYFSRHCLVTETSGTPSRVQKKERSIWQRRYWEHLIEDDEDFKRHVHYIHYNPVKHRLVDAPKDWLYSSFHSYVKKGVYEKEWGSGGNITFIQNVEGE